MTRQFLIACALCFAYFTPPLVVAQNVTERSVEVRTSFAFQVSAPAVQKLLPAGWTVPPSTDANKGRANINVTMMDRLMVVDAKGQPFGTGSIRYLVITTAARNVEGKTGTLVIGGISPDSPGSYDVYLPATIARVDRTTEAQGVELGRTKEAWQFAAASGEKVDVVLTYRRGHLTKSHNDAVVRSGRHPEFQRTYHIDQASEVVLSPDSSDLRIETIGFKLTGGFLSPLFDEGAKLLTVTSVPWYFREITVP